jgi:hypothetical protein
MSDEKPDRLPDFPTDDKRSVGFHVGMASADAVASVIPGGSYAVQQIIKQFIGEPLERRREAWFVLLGEGLRDLQDKLDGFDPRCLTDNEAFVSTVAETTRIAMTTHRAERLEALRNIVLNTAIGLTVDDVAHGMFMALVERFSALHVQVLRILHDPFSSPEIRAAFNDPIVIPTWDALRISLRHVADAATISVVLNDIIDARLAEHIDRASLSPDPMTSRCLTPLGESFVQFIASPLANHAVGADEAGAADF